MSNSISSGRKSLRSSRSLKSKINARFKSSSKSRKMLTKQEIYGCGRSTSDRIIDESLIYHGIGRNYSNLKHRGRNKVGVMSSDSTKGRININIKTPSSQYSLNRKQRGLADDQSQKSVI